MIYSMLHFDLCFFPDPSPRILSLTNNAIAVPREAEKHGCGSGRMQKQKVAAPVAAGKK